MEEKRYFVYAYDAIYGGLHGMYDFCFVDGSLSEAEEYGYEMSYGVIESYSDIYESLCDEDASEQERDDAVCEDIAFEVWELRDDAPSFKELEAMNLDPESYIKEYCQPCRD